MDSFYNSRYFNILYFDTSYTYKNKRLVYGCVCKSYFQ